MATTERQASRGSLPTSPRSTGGRPGSRKCPDFSGLLERWPGIGAWKVDCRTRLGELQQMELAFIHSREFETLDWSDVDVPPDCDWLYQPVGQSERSNSGGHDLPPYMAHLYRMRLLTAEGEVALFKLMNFLKFWANVLRSRLSCASRRKDKAIVEALLVEADRVRDQIVQANLRLVVAIARKFSSSRQEFDELVSEGNMILINAVDKFDYSRGFRFSTYTTHAVQRHFYRRWQTQQRRRQRIQAAPQELLYEMPEQSEDRSFDPEPVQELQRLIERLDDCLDHREKLIVIERFGLGKTEAGRTLRQIAEDLGISKERVRQLQFKAIDKLRAMAVELGLNLSLA